MNAIHPDTRLRPFDSKNGRYFEFSQFEFLGGEFMASFALGFVRYSSTVAHDTAQGAYSSALNFLRWLKDNAEKFPYFVSILQSNHTKAYAKDWEIVIALWRDNLVSQPRPGTLRKYNLIKGLNTLLKKLGGFGVIPKLTYINAPQKFRRTARATKTLAEVSRGGIQNGTVDILEKAMSTAKGTELELQVKKDFLTTLLNETGNIAGTAEQHARALMQINADRLATIRRCASEVFQKWRDHWHEGQRILKSCDMGFEEIYNIVHPQQRMATQSRHEALSKLFPTDNPEITIARLLKYYSALLEFRGALIRTNRIRVSSGISKLLSHFGGIEALQAYLFPHPQLIVAVITIILCDTGANVSVAWSLRNSCLKDSKDPSFKLIQGTKIRAGGKLIVNELPIKDSLHDISCVEAIETYQQMSESIRAIAKKDVADHLFIYIGFSGLPCQVGNLWWTRRFRTFRNLQPDLQNLNIQAKMIRPSVLMQASYDKETGIIAAAAVGDHNSLSTTNTYIARFPNQVIWERMIREFQSLLQAVSIKNIDGAAAKLGLTSEQVEKLFSEACRTGLGVACIDPKAGIQAGSEKGKTCTQVQNCPQCPNRFVVATVENLKDLILWNRHLEKYRPQWELSQPGRWERVWLPWLVFTQVAIEQASRGRTTKEFKTARELADERTARLEVNLPPLW